MSDKKSSIPNWSIFSIHSVSIQVFEDKIDNVIIYNPMLTFYLNDGEKNGDKKVISIQTDIYDENLENAVWLAGLSVNQQFDNLADIVIVLSSEGAAIKELSLTEMMNTVMTKQMITSDQVSTTLH